MLTTMPTLTDDEILRCLPVDEEPGFGALATERGPLPLKAMDVRARLDGLLAEVEVSQTFVNTHAEPLEATYIFPLPDRAAVTHFRMEVGGRVVEGVLKERGQARRDYDQALRQGHRAAITEEERPGVFTMRVGNLMPGDVATVRLTLTGPLIYDSGEATFRFPLVVAPRYIPGSALPGESVGAGTAQDTDAVPDASRISPPVLLPGYPNPVRLSLAVEVEPSALAPREFRSSLHTVLVGEDTLGRRTIRLEAGERLDRDFVMRFRVGGESVGSSLALVPDGQGAREGTFVLTLVPPAGASRSLKPRDVVFVLDRSGSMSGWKMVAARRALARMVDTLTDRDRFTVYAFDDPVETPAEFRGAGLAAATDRGRFRAVEFLARVDARGGTEMAAPLDLAVRQLAEAGPGRDRILVLITDGQVGNEDQILKLLGKRLDGLRVFTLGIDQAVNEGFLRRLAVLGGGFCEVVESEDRLDEVMRRLHSRLASPVLRNLALEASGIKLEAETVVPGRLPDLFPGAALQVMGRYRGAPEGALKLSGEDVAGRRWAETVGSRYSDNTALTKAWARAHLRELEDRFATGNADPAALERRIVEVSLRHGVLCRFTAFVAVDRSASVNEGGEVRQVVQPVEMPAGWDAPRVVARGGMMSMSVPMAAAMEAVPEQTLHPAPPSGAVWRGGVPDTARPMARKAKACRSGQAPPSKPARQSPPPRGESSGLLGKLFGALFGRGKEAEGEGAAPAADARETGALDLTAYRRRAGELVDQARAALSLATTERMHELGVLAGQLAALVEDLKSIGAPAPAVEPLERLLVELRHLLAFDAPPAEEAERLLRRCEEVLGEFADNATGTGSSRFWK